MRGTFAGRRFRGEEKWARSELRGDQAIHWCKQTGIQARGGDPGVPNKREFECGVVNKREFEGGRECLRRAGLRAKCGEVGGQTNGNSSEGEQTNGNSNGSWIISKREFDRVNQSIKRQTGIQEDLWRPIAS